MSLPTRITLPPSGRSPGGILGAARPIPAADWWRGVTFTSGQCVPPQNVGTCTDQEETKTPQHLSEVAVFDAFAVVVALECATMGNPNLAEYAGVSLDVTREFAVASELLTGAASGNPNLQDAAEMAAGADPVSALGCIDQYASTSLSGRLAFIHVSPLVATALKSSFAIETFDNGRTYRTASGNLVVISAGYDGRGPGANAPAAGDSLFIYATGEVYASVGERADLQAVERGQNTLHSIAEDAAVIAFDPCFNVAIDSGLTYCDVTS